MIDTIQRSLHAMGFLKKSKSPPILFVEIIIGLLLSLSSVLIFAKFGSEILEKETNAFDSTVSYVIYSLRTPFLNDFMLYISYLGADFIVVVGTLISIGLAWKHHKHEAALFVLVLALGFLLNILLKIIYARPRPDFDPLLDLSATFSFPSGHAMNAFIFYALISYFCYHFTKNRLLTIIVACVSVVIVFLIGVSRVYLGVHYPTDVLAGFVAGFCVVITAISLEKTLTLLRLKKK